MSLVLFRAFPISSHYNATFKIAQRLHRKYGHRIIYLGNDNFSQTVIANGFEYIHVTAGYVKVNSLLDGFHNVQAGNNPTTTLASPFAKYLGRIKSLKLLRRVRLGNEAAFIRLFKDLNPDLVFIDTFYDYEVPMYYKNNIPFAVYQTKFSTNQEKNVPPLTSKFVPSDSKFSLLYCRLLWMKYFTVARFIKLRDFILYFGNDSQMTLKRCLRRFAYPQKFVFTNRTFNPGFIKAWEFILAPFELDFKRELSPFQISLGCVVDSTRHDTDYDWAFLQFRERHLIPNEEMDKSIIYCSLGSISEMHSKYCKSFYLRLISALENDEGYVLVLSVGFSYSLGEFKSSAANVFIFQKVPQLEMLSRCSMMITHGGMQSISECVLSKVPMLIFPLNHKWDQNGNSARVIYHRLGLRGDLEHDSKELIKAKIDEVLRNHEFKLNVTALADKINHSEKFEEGIDFLARLILDFRFRNDDQDSF